MKLKMSEDGKLAVVADGKPVFVHDDGKEIAFDVPSAVATLTRTLDESKKYKERAQAAETKLAAFNGIEDAEAAKKALETLKNIDEGKLLSAGKVEEIKAAAKKAAEDTVAAAAKAHLQELEATKIERERIKSQLHKEKITNAFATSKFVAENMVGTPRMVQNNFHERFAVGDDGQIIARGSDGTPVQSHEKFGEPAGFEEAIKTIVQQDPDRDHWLKGSGNRGDGARGSNGGGGANNGGKRTITRVEFDKLDPIAQRNAAIGKDAMQVVD